MKPSGALIFVRTTKTYNVEMPLYRLYTKSGSAAGVYASHSDAARFAAKSNLVHVGPQ